MDVIFDIDGTLLDISHRLKHIKKTPKDWAAFRDPKEKVHDDPIMPIINIARAFLYSPSDRVIFASGRSEEERVDTVLSLSEWFLLDGWQKVTPDGKLGDAVETYPTSPFYMRAEKDYRKDTVVKREMYEQMLVDGYKPKLVFDDRPSVLRMWREIEGLKVVDVGYGVEF